MELIIVGIGGIIFLTGVVVGIPAAILIRRIWRRFP